MASEPSWVALRADRELYKSQHEVHRKLYRGQGSHEARVCRVPMVQDEGD